MEIGILIGLILTNVILIFLGSRQRKAFRYTERQLRDELLSTEARLQDKLLEKIEEIKQHQMQLQRTLLNATARRQNALIEKIEEVNPKIEEVEILLKQYRASTFDYQSPWWQDYSWLYRHVRGWQCEECQLSLNLDRQYLHTHHISGTQHNDPNDLKALCIACHSEQPGTNHHRLTTLEDYPEFMEKYGEQRKVQLDAILSESE